MRYKISHKTIYEYTEHVSFCQNKAFLKLRDAPGQQVISSVLQISPPAFQFEDALDFYGNRVSLFTIQEPHKRLEIEVLSQVSCLSLPVPLQSMEWNVVRDFIAGDLNAKSLEAQEFLFDSPHVPAEQALHDYAVSSFPMHRPLVEALEDLNKRIFTDFKYRPLTTTISTPISEVLQTRGGVCQDFAHLMIGCLRSLGIPARYVSGYLRTLPPPGKPRLVGADASHAWVSAFVPGHGWLDLDPTNGTIPGDEHITVAWGRDFSDVSPIRGIVIGGAGQTLSVAVDVEPIAEPVAVKAKV
ncbi:MAG: transglutaminase domain-containing protein [Sumerlaeia bacterium]